MRKFFSLLAILALSACAGASTATAPQSLPQALPQSATMQFDGSTSSAGTTWNVQTGASVYSYAVQDLDFYPGSITIDAGDSIAFRVASGSGGDAHTISYVPPGHPVPSPGDPNNLKPAGGKIVDGTTFVNSGIVFGGQIFTLYFTKPGTYKILCLFHEPAMAMTVTVQSAGARYPHTAGYYLDTGASEEWEDLDEGAASIAQFPFTPGGTTIAAGISPGLLHFPPPDSTVLRFIDSPDRSTIASAGNKTIKAGTTLTWTNESTNEPHTITFALAGQHDLPAIPPDPAVNVTPGPGITSIDGTKVVNSGTIVGGGSFRARFDKPGHYFYGCLYHDNSRMVGTITVTP